MQVLGIISWVWVFIRKYLVAAALIVAFATTYYEVYVTGVGPMPQHPPEGYSVERGHAVLQWNKGTKDEPINLQISMDDPGFTKPIVDRKMTGISYTARELIPGHNYYWRLVQGDAIGPVASFKTSTYAIAL